MDEWKLIPEFPGYLVSRDGRVRNQDSGRILVLTSNQNNVTQVGLMKNSVQHKRGVALLVADAFLPRPDHEAFNTPINLDGDRGNNHVDNLMWRPRWFAIQYHRQFHNGKRGFNKPVIDVETGERFNTSWEAATKFGLLDREIMIATLNRTYVWPTYQKFRVIEQ